MNQQNPNLQQQTPNGQPTPQQQHQQLQQQQLLQQQQQQVNLGHPNDTSANGNWRTEVSVPERTRFVSQLSLALKHLSPSTSDNETYNVASNFEAGLYHRCSSKNQYILAYAKKFQHIRDQINQQQQQQQQQNNTNGGLQQPMSPSLVGNTNASLSPQLQRSNFQQPSQQQPQNSPLNLNQQQHLMRPQQPMFNQQGRPQPPQQPQPQPQQMNANQQSQMYLYQRNVAAAAMAVSNNTPNGPRPPMQPQQQQMPMNLLQNMNATNAAAAAQAGLTFSPQQFQVFVARQMALQQQQSQQQQQSSPQQQGSPIQQGYLPQQPQQQQNLGGMTQQQLMNMQLAAGNGGMNKPNPIMNGQFRPQQPPQQQQDSTSLSGGSPMQQHTNYNSNTTNNSGNSAASTPIAVPASLPQQQNKQGLFNPGMVRPQQPNSQQAQHMVNQEMIMQRFQQQQLQQQQQAAIANTNNSMVHQHQRPPQQPQQFMPQQPQRPPQQSQQFVQQRPMMMQQGPQQQPQHQAGPLKPLTFQQRNSAAAIVRQMDESVRQGRVRGAVIEDLSEQDKIAIREQMAQMKTMYDKIDNLLPVFLAMTSNGEATRRLILMKYMFEDQLLALNTNTYLISLENLHKLREQFSGYFTWVRNAVGQQQQQQQAQMNAMGAGLGGNQQQPQQQPQQQQVGLGLLPMHMQQQQQQQQGNYNPQQAMMNQSQAMLRQQQQQDNNIGGPVPNSNENTPVIANATTAATATTTATPTMAHTSVTPTTSSMGIKRGSIDLKLPPAKKQRASKAANNSPTLNRKNQKAAEKKEAAAQAAASSAASANSVATSVNTTSSNVPNATAPDNGTSVSAPALTMTSQPVTSNVAFEMNSNSTNNSPALINKVGLSHPMNSYPQQQQQPMSGNLDANSSGGGVPVKGGMPLSQHQAKTQSFYMAAVSNGIPPQIVSLLPPKALQYNWVLQQAAQNKMTLMPNQQQQIQDLLNDHIEAAKHQLTYQQTSSPNNNNNNSNTSTQSPQVMPQQQQQQPLPQNDAYIKHEGTFIKQEDTFIKQEDTRNYNTHPQQPYTLMQHHHPMQQASPIMNNNNNTPTNNSTPTMIPNNTVATSTSTSNTTTNGMIVQPSMTLQPGVSAGGGDDVMSSIYFNPHGANASGMTMGANTVPPPQTQDYYPSNMQPAPPQAAPRSQPPQQDTFEYALKEGYKDETFGTPDLSLSTRVNKHTEASQEVVVGESWYDSNVDDGNAGFDLGLDGFDWDNNDFVKLDDNEALVTPGVNNNEQVSSATGTASSKQKDDKKLMDESGKLCAVSL